MSAPRVSPLLRLLLVTFSLAIAGVASAAAPVVIQDSGPVASPSATLGTSATCTWSTGTPSNTSVYPVAPDYFTAVAARLPADACPTCGTGQPLEIQSVSFRVRWLAACSAQVTASVVAATTGSGCSLVPDPSAVLAGPVTTTISSSAAGGVIHTVPLPAGNCVQGDAFVLLQFTGFDTCTGPLTLGTTACVNCEQLFTTANSPGFSDWCPFVQGANSFWVSVDAACCIATPTRDHSWGEMKIRYR